MTDNDVYSYFFYIKKKKKYKRVMVLGVIIRHSRKWKGKMLEKQIEKAFVMAVRSRGGWCPKFASPGTDGMPDRLVLMPGGRMAFAELKAPGQKPRPLQLARHEALRALGYSVYVIDGLDQIGGVLDEICAEAVSGIRD